MNPKRKKIGLALGSGGQKGGAHIGVIKVLLQNKIPIDYIAGSSAGAVVGAYLALHGDIKDMEERMKGFTRRNLLELLDFNDPRNSIIKGERMKEYCEKWFYGAKKFGDTKIPLRITASILEDGRLVEIGSGKLSNAVVASGTVPGIFPPVPYKGKHLVDGGVLDPVPVDVVKRMGADIVIAVDISGFKKSKMQDLGATHVLYRSYQLMYMKSTESASKDYGKEIVLIKPEVDKIAIGLPTIEFYNTKNYIGLGEAAARKALPKIRKLMRE